MFTETESGLVIARDLACGMQEMRNYRLRGHRISLWGDEKVLEVGAAITQHCECVTALN